MRCQLYRSPEGPGSKESMKLFYVKGRIYLEVVLKKNKTNKKKEVCLIFIYFGKNFGYKEFWIKGMDKQRKLQEIKCTDEVNIARIKSELVRGKSFKSFFNHVRKNKSRNKTTE